MLKGALHELVIGRTDRLSTDVGPVITAEAKARIRDHIEAMNRAASPSGEQPLPPGTKHGTFVPPTIIEIDQALRPEAGSLRPGPARPALPSATSSTG